MKLLILGPQIDDPAEITNFGGLWSYYLAQTFRSMGIALRFCPQMKTGQASEIIAYHASLDLDDIDHVLAVGTGYLAHIPQECCEDLKRRCRGAVTQIYDGRSSAPVDCTFTVKRLRRSRDNHFHVGWAADPTLCRPEQRDDELRILIDHTDYVGTRVDRTLEIFEQARAYARGSYRPVKVRRIVNGGFVDADANTETYTRVPCSYLKCCEEYSRTHLFMVTHKESVGQVILETAMAGALPVVPEGFVNVDRLQTVRHLCYSGRVPWATAIARLNVKKSRAVALANNWPAVAQRIVSWFKRFRKQSAPLLSG